MERDGAVSSERRSFLTRLNMGFAGFAAVAGLAKAQQRPAPSARWEPARHEIDEWLDKPGLKHRLMFDTTGADEVGNALAFGQNFFRTNQTAYGVENSEIAVLIVLRHLSAGFGLNDAMWAKYGATLTTRTKAEDPKTKQTPSVNIYNATGFGELLPNRGITLESMAKMGADFAVCTLSTRANAAFIARASGSTPDAVFKELSANLISNARLVPAGIVTVSRAQEHGYSIATC
jgi:intracellular sulfur oxidation DsrE/DsrF family protein